LTRNPIGEVVEVIDIVARHGLLLLTAWVFVEQFGAPIPTVPILLAAGALSRTGRLSLSMALVLCVLASLVADWVWYEAGRRKGVRVLHLLCRVSLEPDSCVRWTEDVLSRQGARTLLFGKFLPGVNTVAPPLAGVIGMSRGRFLALDALGSALWAGTFLGLGALFRGEIERLANSIDAMGRQALVVLGGALACYVAYKLVARHRLLSELRVARIDAEELKARLDAGESFVIVDLRHAIEVDADPETIPGALRVDADHIPQDHAWLPPDRDVILFCT
jgi:membrane protein DedA with SNARE-associated domain